MRLLQALILSLALHFLIGFILDLRHDDMPRPVSAIDNMVEFIEEPAPRSDEDRNIVRSQDLPEELKKSGENEKAEFYSEDDQTVLEQTRAAESGMTKNRSLDASRDSQGSRGSSKSIAQNQNQDSKSRKLNPQDLFEIERRPLSTDDIVVEEAQEEAETEEQSSEGNPLRFPDMAAFGLERGRSTFGESVPSDVKLGSFTALNTDRHLYYSFYARAEELVRHHWENYVRSVLYSYQRSGAATGDEYWITRVEILLDSEGNFVKGVIHQSSGLNGLDLAPIHAFKDAKQIPHPPTEMVKEDGLIRMNYEFNVRMVSSLAGG